MTEDRVTGLVGIGVLTLLAVFVLVYAISLVRHHDNPRELAAGLVLICFAASAALGGVIFVVLGATWTM